MNERPSSLLALSAALLSSCAALAGCAAAVIPLQHPTHPQAVPAVARLLSDDPTLVEEAQVEVSTLGEGATPELLRAMRSATPEGKIRLLDAATKIGKPAGVVAQIYREAVRDSDQTVRQSAAIQAGRAPELSKQTTPAIRALLGDPVPEVRSAALRSLASLDSGASLSSEEILAAVDSPDPLICATGVSIAFNRGDSSLSAPLRRALPRLILQIRNPKPATRAAVVAALGQYGKNAAPAVPSLTTVTRDDSVAEVRVQAAVALMRIGTPAAKAAARETFSEFSSSQNEALKALSKGYLSQPGAGAES